MGYWGSGLYENDVAQDVLLSFQRLLPLSGSPSEACIRTEAEFLEELNDPEDAPIVCSVLADQLLQFGIQREDITKKALAWIDNGGDYLQWAAASPECASLRCQELARLKKRFTDGASAAITSPVKQKKKQWQWQTGEVYAMRLSSSFADELALHGEYLLFYILGEYETIDGYENPRVWVKLTKNGVLPQNAEEFNRLDFLQVASTAFSDRYRPFAGENDLPPSFRQSYQCDAWGFLREYTIAMIQTNGSHPPENLLLLGLFNNILAPKDEYQRYHSALCCAWKYAEELLLKDYWLHNLHNAAIYQY